MQIVGRTETGKIRQKNEDAIYIGQDLMIVADGMGGHIGGEIASRIAVDSIVKELAELSSEASLMGDVDRAIQYANHNIAKAVEEDERLTGMGTTLTLCLFRLPVVVIGHVGDSRAYLFRNGLLSRLTRDHSLVEEMVRGGIITPEEAVNHPHRHVITRALGASGRVRVDVKRVGVEPGDRLLLCSDGLTLHVTDGEIQSMLCAEKELSENVHQLVALSMERGGEDNISILMALMEEEDAV